MPKNLSNLNANVFNKAFRCNVSLIKLAKQKECGIVEGHIKPDQAHMCIEISSNYKVYTFSKFSLKSNY